MEAERAFAWGIVNNINVSMRRCGDMNEDQFSYLCMKMGFDSNEFKR